jgi:molecular chaperone GrpE (heat shock protein)
MIAQDANTLRAAADYHRRAADETSMSMAIQHEEWMETLLDVADLLDRLARLVETPTERKDTADA